MVLEKVYTILPTSATIKKLTEGYYDIELFTPDQLKRLHKACIAVVTDFYSISEARYERMGEAKYEEQEKLCDDAEEWRKFIEETWTEALI